MASSYGQWDNVRASGTTKHQDIDRIEPLDEEVETFHVRTKGIGRPGDSPTSTLRSNNNGNEEYFDENGRVRHGVAELVSDSNSETGQASRDGNQESSVPPSQPPNLTFLEQLQTAKKGYLAYIKTRDFWIVLALGQVLSLCLTGTNTFTQLLGLRKTNIPAFQTFFNYCLLNIIYTSFTIYKYGFKKWGTILIKDSWRFLILSFCDVEGNYFTVLAYEYTNILSAQLINFWAIVIVVAVSFTVLKVRYKWTQYAGILICVAGMGILMASDHITGISKYTPPNELKGDLFALAGATFYGFSNIFEEYLVSKRPMYEVLGMLAFWGMLINGTQAAIFDRHSITNAHWDGHVAGYLVGYTLILSLFYTLAPLMFRLGSAAFFNISLLTANFWGAIIGIHVFHLPVYYLYPIAFVLIVIGLIIYFTTESVLGQARKPWLGENQEKGVDGIGTARRKAENLKRQVEAGNSVV